MIKGSNKYKELAESIKGIYTVQTLGKRLKINEKKAIYVIYRLRKLGYVKTSYGQGKKRLYYISMDNLHKRISYTQRINEISPIKLASSNPYYIYGRIPSIEETLIYAIKQKEVRYIIASLALFKKEKGSPPCDSEPTSLELVSHRTLSVAPEYSSPFGSIMTFLSSLLPMYPARSAPSLCKVATSRTTPASASET